MMKGLNLAEAYYNAHGAKMIARQFGSYARRIAVGFVGPGSECFGFDDDISRDHDWGPGFCLWLTAEDFKKIGADLQEAYAALPETFMGYGPRVASPAEAGRTGVNTISTFYQTYCGLDRLPASLGEWLNISEQSLATCTNGKVFDDSLGDFSRWREALLKFYPEDVRLKKMASRCLTAAQAGQYNVERSFKRNEFVAALYSEARFCEAVVSLVFLLNKRYTPFYKWMHAAMKELPVLGKLISLMISDLISRSDHHAKLAIIEEICSRIIDQLHQGELSDSNSDFLLDHAYSIHSRISDPNLRERFSMID